MASGCAGLATHFGQTIMEAFHQDPMNSNDRLPEPMMIEARNSMTWIPDARSLASLLPAAQVLRKGLAGLPRPPR